jgi:predicted ATPase
MRKITEINITKLWGDPDLNIHWKLNPDVNVLAGDNGSGKSTVLNLVAGLLHSEYKSETAQKAESIEIIFEDGNTISFNQKDGFAAYQDFKKEYLREITINISTFDQDLIPHYKEIQEQTPSLETTRTTLDLELFEIKQNYITYFNQIGSLAAEALFNNTANATALKDSVKIQLDKQNLFFDIIDKLFAHSQKTINRRGSELYFTNNLKEKIKLHQLSSGEKQLLIILLTALIRAEKPCILMMDEPEMSLHPDWQRTLIDNIRILNEQVQLIIATHAPLLIVNGWAGNVQQMDKIITPKPTK